MVAGHLQEKNDYFYTVLNYTNHERKLKSKWITTGLTVKSNKAGSGYSPGDKENFVPDIPTLTEDMFFYDFLEQWLEIAKGTIQLTTYSNYSGMCKQRLLHTSRKRHSN